MEAFFKSLLGIGTDQLYSGMVGRVFHVLGAIFATALGLAILLIEPGTIGQGEIRPEATAAGQSEAIPFTSRLVFSGLMFVIAAVCIRQVLHPEKPKS